MDLRPILTKERGARSGRRSGRRAAPTEQAQPTRKQR